MPFAEVDESGLPYVPDLLFAHDRLNSSHISCFLEFSCNIFGSLVCVVQLSGFFFLMMARNIFLGFLM